MKLKLRNIYVLVILALQQSSLQSTTPSCPQGTIATHYVISGDYAFLAPAPFCCPKDQFVAVGLGACKKHYSK